MAALIITAMILILVTPVLATPPPENPGKGHPEFDRIVFIHYKDNFARGGGNGNKAPQLYSYSGYHRASGDVSYWINLNGNRVTAIGAITGIQASFQTWQDDPDSQIVFGYQGTTSVYQPGLNATSPDYQNVVGWAYLSDSYPDAIAVTIVWATRGNKLIVDSDTALNTDSYFAWTQADITANPDTTLLPPTPAYDLDIQNNSSQKERLQS